MKNTKCKDIQPLCGMELQGFYKKVKLFKLTYFSVQNTKSKPLQPLFLWSYKDLRDLHWPQSHSFKTTVILITKNVEKAFFGKKPFKV